jgi:hypothetical protein
METRSEGLSSGRFILRLYVSLPCLHFADLFFFIDPLLGLDYPYILSLLPNNAIEVHSIETQAIMQVISSTPVTSPPSSKPTSPAATQTTHQRSSSSSATADSSRRTNLISSVGGYLVPSTQRSEKMSMVPVKLLRT